MVRSVSGLAGLTAVHLTAAAAAGAMAVAPVGAQEPSLHITVTATAQNACNFDASAAELDFGAVIPGQSKTATATLTILCAFDGSPTVHIGEGGNFSDERRHLKHEENDGVLVPYRVCTTIPNDNDCEDWPDTGFGIDASSGSNTVDIHALITEQDSDNFTEEGDYEDTLLVEVAL